MIPKSGQMSSNRGVCGHMPTAEGLGSGCLSALILTVVHLYSFLHLLPLFPSHPQYLSLHCFIKVTWNHQGVGVCCLGEGVGNSFKSWGHA